MMKTKIVYALISDDKSIYAEQAWCSIWSLKHFTPEAHVTIVTDSATNENIQNSYRQEILSLVDELIIADLPQDTSNAYRSRWIKTRLRQLVSGDFLFVDTDTIVTSSIAAIDNCTNNIAMVLDLHCPLPRHPHRQVLVERQKKYFHYNYDIANAPNYYNSGVIYCKDTDQAYNFYDAWHEAWKQSSAMRKGLPIDQLPLMKVLWDHPNMVSELGGEYNCQVLCSIQYFNRAKIIHFFNSPWLGQPVSKFFTKEFYRGIQRARGLNEDFEQEILHCKDSFTSPSFVIGADAIQQLADANDFFNYEWLKIYRRFPMFGHISDGMANIAAWVKKKFCH